MLQFKKTKDYKEILLKCLRRKRKKIIKKNVLKMKDIASVEYVAGDIEIFEDDGLCQSTNSLKIVVDTNEDETNNNFVTVRASSNSNLQKIGADNESTTISHARSENMIPLLLKKKSRLISTDSGFGSYGPELYNSGSVDSMAHISSGPKYTSIHTRPIVNTITHQENDSPANEPNTDSTEKEDKISPLISETAAVAESTPKVKKYLTKNHRNTTQNSIDDNFELDPKLINRDDGFHEVQCYINEHGSPMVREKRQRSNRKKSTLKEELKARSLGASFDDNLLIRKDTNKTPSCVSFSRLFKKLRETFCKLLNVTMPII